MDFIKKHYEKVILSVVLLGLAVAAGLLPIMVSTEKDRIQTLLEGIRKEKAKEYKPVDLTVGDTALQAVIKPPKVKLHGEHNLFNPVRWQKMPNGQVISVRTGREIGPGALQPAKISPLYTILEFIGATKTGDLTQYRFRITREAAKVGKAPVTLSVTGSGSKVDNYVLKKAEPADNPERFFFESIEDKQQIEISKDKPHKVIAGYSTDLKYPPENLSFNGKRVADSITFGGETYKIVAITETDVTVAAASQKRTTVSLGASR